MFTDHAEAALLLAGRLGRSLSRRLVAAVAPRGVAARLAGGADEIVCLEEPPVFFSVDEHFADFREVEDTEVVAILERSAARRHEVAAAARG